MDVGIVGGSGYGGAELVRLLAGHSAFKLRTVAAGASAGRRLGEVFSHLAPTPQADLALVPSEPEELDGCAVVFLATPHEVSRALAPELVAQGAVVVDLSDAFRLGAAPLHRQVVDAADLGLAALDGRATGPVDAGAYGLPELFRTGLGDARLVANPGCYPTAALLALAPLAGLVDPTSVVVVGMSGTSGAGRGLRDDLHASHAFANVAPYGAPTHRHTAEIGAGWAALSGDQPIVTFVPHLVPMARGLLCTVTADLEVDPTDVRPAYDARYAAEPFVTVLDERAWPETTHVTGSNSAHVGVAVDADAGRAIASCAIDNLVKGAAGQAIQCANVALGLAETDGLPTAGLYP